MLYRFMVRFMSLMTRYVICKQKDSHITYRNNQEVTYENSYIYKLWN